MKYFQYNVPCCGSVVIFYICYCKPLVFDILFHSLGLGSFQILFHWRCPFLWFVSLCLPHSQLSLNGPFMMSHNSWRFCSWFLTIFPVWSTLFSRLNIVFSFSEILSSTRSSLLVMLCIVFNLVYYFFYFKYLVFFPESLSLYWSALSFLYFLF